MSTHLHATQITIHCKFEQAGYILFSFENFFEVHATQRLGLDAVKASSASVGTSFNSFTALCQKTVVDYIPLHD